MSDNLKEYNSSRFMSDMVMKSNRHNTLNVYRYNNLHVSFFSFMSNLNALVSEDMACSYQGGHLNDLALAFLNERNVRALMFESSADRRFRELQSFLKGVRVRPIERLWRGRGGNPPPYKPITRLVPRAGHHLFPKDDRETSVEVMKYSIL